MAILTIEITIDRALKLLQNLEDLNVIRVLKNCDAVGFMKYKYTDKNKLVRDGPQKYNTSYGPFNLF